MNLKCVMPNHFLPPCTCSREECGHFKVSPFSPDLRELLRTPPPPRYNKVKKEILGCVILPNVISAPLRRPFFGIVEFCGVKKPSRAPVRGKMKNVQPPSALSRGSPDRPSRETYFMISRGVLWGRVEYRFPLPCLDVGLPRAERDRSSRQPSPRTKRRTLLGKVLSRRFRASPSPFAPAMLPRRPSYFLRGVPLAGLFRPLVPSSATKVHPRELRTAPPGYRTREDAARKTTVVMPIGRAPRENGRGLADEARRKLRPDEQLQRVNSTTTVTTVDTTGGGTERLDFLLAIKSAIAPSPNDFQTLRS